MPSFPRGGRVRWPWAVASAVAVGFLLVVPFVPGASAGPLPSISSASSEWAYGANRSVSGTIADRGGTLTVSERAGYVVVLSQAPGANGTFQVEADRAMGVVLDASYCEPSCSSPQITGSVQFHAFEILDGSATVTTNGSVALDGTTTPAYAVTNASLRLSSGWYDNDSLEVRGAVSTHSASSNLSLSLAATYGIAFDPALGLAPISPGPGESWTSTSAYESAGSWAASYAYTRTGLGGLTTSRSGTPTGTLAGNGSVTLWGTDLGGLRLSDGVAVQQVGLTLTGGLRLLEGFLFVPTDADLFGAVTRTDLPSGNATLAESFGAVDLGASAGGHLAFLASSTTFTPSAASIADASSDEAIPAATGAPSSFVVQAEPESVPASTTRACTALATCGAPGGASGAAGGRVVVIGVALTGAIAVVAVVAVAVARRPRAPPRPNAALYPPLERAEAASANAARPRRASSDPPPEIGEPDPLSHLW